MVKRVNITERILCAEGRVADSCKGDSGGPFVAVGLLKQPKYIQYGIIAAGPKCEFSEDHHTPGIYTRVTKFMRWILDNIQE